MNLDPAIEAAMKEQKDKGVTPDQLDANYVAPVTPEPVAPPAEPPKVEPPPAPPVTPETPPVEPPKVEPPVEPVTPPVPEPKDLSGLLTTPAEPVAAPPTEPEKFDPAKLPQEIQDQLKLAAEYKQMVEDNNNPLILAYKLGKTPEDLMALAKELVPEDLSTRSFEELVRLDLKNKIALEGADLDDAVEQYMKDHQELPKYKQALEEKTLRDAFKPTAKESSFLKSWQKELDERLAAQPTPMTKEAAQAIIDKDLNAINEVGKEFIGGKAYGVEFTAEMLKEMSAQYNAQEVDMYYAKPDGTIDAKKWISDKFFKDPKMIATMLNNEYERGKQDKAKELQVIPGGGNNNNSGHTTVPVDKEKAMLEFLFTQPEQ